MWVLGCFTDDGSDCPQFCKRRSWGETRLSTMLHGLWLLILVIAAPTLLKMILISSLAAILVVTGYKLIEVEHIRQLKKYGRFPLVIFFATFIGIIVADLITGVLIGILLTGMLLIYKMSVLNIQIIKHEHNQRIDSYMVEVRSLIVQELDREQFLLSNCP